MTDNVTWSSPTVGYSLQWFLSAIASSFYSYYRLLCFIQTLLNPRTMIITSRGGQQCFGPEHTEAALLVFAQLVSIQATKTLILSIRSREHASVNISRCSEIDSPTAAPVLDLEAVLTNTNRISLDWTQLTGQRGLESVHRVSVSPSTSHSIVFYGSRCCQIILRLAVYR
jgi:hypothetical protein